EPRGGCRTARRAGRRGGAGDVVSDVLVSLVCLRAPPHFPIRGRTGPDPGVFCPAVGKGLSAAGGPAAPGGLVGSSGRLPAHPRQRTRAGEGAKTRRWPYAFAARLSERRTALSLGTEPRGDGGNGV